MSRKTYGYGLQLININDRKIDTLYIKIIQYFCVTPNLLNFILACHNIQLFQIQTEAWTKLKEFSIISQHKS